MDVRYPLPLIPNCTKKLSGKRFYAKLDLKDGFHQLGMDEKSKWIIAFVTLNGLYDWIVVPFGVKNGPAIYQKTIKAILIEYEGRICIVFIDDINIFAVTWIEFLVNLDKVLTRLEENNVTVKLKKCYFGSPETEFLVHVANFSGVR